MYKRWDFWHGFFAYDSQYWGLGVTADFMGDGSVKAWLQVGPFQLAWISWRREGKA